ncbi:hypothetical protein [Granulicella arctica]|uniref:Uncharacterized protein n=1 Tax=Granulicella arctica TaxID=940613 RepID=A0A7Y9TJI2_9BACT|nr:hypothetical protein [Granulicella arctica]NYF78297.1 hypothetical protein [Granulicella arctica]
MKKLMRTAGVGLALAACGAAVAQMHKVAKPETVVRAVGVYEWRGDMAKPTASRLIPVTLYIDQHLEDAGLYMARPVPFALDSGNIYELDQSGVPKGNLDLVYARHLQATNVAESYDDGWFGYGSFKGLAAPKKAVTRKLPPARTSGIVTSDVDSDRPHFVNRAGQPVTPASAGGGDTAGAGDSKASASDAGAGNAPAGDPDRPTMKRRSGNDTASTPSTSTSSGTDSGTVPADDPDRPTLKRHSVEDAKKKAKESSEASVSGGGTLNDDPDRPSLHRGKPAHALTETDLPKLSGLPVDLQQMVAVSDAVNRPEHDFARAWEDEAEHAAILTKMQAIARAQLATYAVANPVVGGAPAATTSTVAKKTPTSKLRRPLQAAPVGLLDEQLKGFTLSYGDVPTFVYQAHTDGTGGALRYVTVVAQLDAQSEPVVVLHGVTDAAHLDRTARLRLVDAVDVEASNRASLLFEMRGQTSRQFGVYRVLGLQAQQTFATGTMQ